MKEELQGKLVEILTSIQSAAGKASDFAMEQLPDIAQSYVAFGRASLTLYVLASLVALVFIWWKAVPKIEMAVDAEGFGYFSGVMLSVAPVIVVLANTSSTLLVWFAPKVWLLKEIAGMLK